MGLNYLSIDLPHLHGGFLVVYISMFFFCQSSMIEEVGKSLVPAELPANNTTWTVGGGGVGGANCCECKSTDLHDAGAGGGEEGEMNPHAPG